MSLDEKLELLRREDASEDALRDAIHDLGEEGPPALHPYVVPFLAHPSPLVRYQALNTLGILWALPQYAERFGEIMRTDPQEDGHVRRIAAFVLGHVLRGSRDKGAAGLLITKIRDDSEDPSVREEAYSALLKVWAHDSAKFRDYTRSYDLQKHEEQRLYDKGLEAKERGEKETAAALFTEADNLWKSRVDWNYVDAIKREMV